MMPRGAHYLSKPVDEQVALNILFNMNSISDIVLRKIREIRQILEIPKAIITVSDDDDDDNDVIFIKEVIVIPDNDEEKDMFDVTEIGKLPI